VYDEVHNLAFLCLMLLVEALELEGLTAVLAEEVVVQEDDCLVPEDHPQLFEKHCQHPV
jgi:hypothetical protein